MLSDVKLWPQQHTMNPATTLDPEAVTPRPSAERLAERIEQVAEDREDSSKRLHLEIADLERRIEALAAAQSANEVRLTRIDSTPVDADKIKFSGRIIAAVVAIVLGPMAANYATTYGLRSDVRDILTRQEQRDRIEELNRKLSDQQSETLSKQVDVVDKAVKLQALEIQTLKEMVLRVQGGQKP